VLFAFPCAPVALALSLVAPQAPPDAPTITAILSAEAEATPAAARPAVEPLPGPAEPNRVHRPRLAPLITGAVAFGVSYGLAVFAAWAYTVVSIDGPEDGSQPWRLLVPLAGPVLAASEDDSGTSRDFGWAAAIAWSVVQVAGTALLIYGAVGHDVPARRRPPDRGVAVTPVVSRTALGLGLTATW
jgi:hypothetical protein